MALKVKINETLFGLGDVVRVTQIVTESDKTRNYTFEGMVIAIKGRGEGKSFTVRRIGEAQVGIERIFPLHSSSIKAVEVVKNGMAGARRAKLFYTRNKSKREIDEIFGRSTRKTLVQAITRKSTSKTKSTSK